MLYDASKISHDGVQFCFPTTPEGVAAMEEQYRKEDPAELPESLRDAAKVLERIKQMGESNE
jgi:hypothetical protein